VQHSLLMLLEQHREGLSRLEKIVEKAAHNPAMRFGIEKRGFVREGYFADLVAVDLDGSTLVDAAEIRYKCGWSPLEGTRFHSRVLLTVVNGVRCIAMGSRPARARRARSSSRHARRRSLPTKRGLCFSSGDVEADTIRDPARHSRGRRAARGSVQQFHVARSEARERGVRAAGEASGAGARVEDRFARRRGAAKAPLLEQEVAYGEAQKRNLVGFLAMPGDAAEPLPGLIVIHEWWGLNDNIKAMTRKLASEGYVALAVDLYNGAKADTPEKAQPLMAAVVGDQEAARANLKQAYDYLDKYALAPRIGSVGWSLGGGWSLQTALMLPDHLRAMVMYYGPITGSQSELSTLQMPVLGFFAGLDESVPVRDVLLFRSTLLKLGKPPRSSSTRRRSGIRESRSRSLRRASHGGVVAEDARVPSREPQGEAALRRGPAGQEIEGKKKRAGCKNIHILQDEDRSMFAAGNPAPRERPSDSASGHHGGRSGDRLFCCSAAHGRRVVRELHLRRRRWLLMLIERSPKLNVQPADVIVDIRAKHRGSILNTEDAEP
jgi:dienelactone hydrolase